MGVRRSVVFWTVILLAFYSLGTFAGSDWTPIADSIAKSVVYVEHPGGSCTGFVINSNAPNQRDYVMTAAHCWAEKSLYADQEPAFVVWKDTHKDLMILSVADLERPALKLAKSNPKQGAELMSFGYGYGLERPMARIAHVSDAQTFIAENGIGGPLIVVDATYVAGMSGGPCVNIEGEVVSIVQLGTQYVGMGVGAEVLRDKTKRYWEKPETGK